METESSHRRSNAHQSFLRRIQKQGFVFDRTEGGMDIWLRGPHRYDIDDIGFFFYLHGKRVAGFS